MLKSQLKLTQQNKGFTLVEVLVAILLTTIFVAVAMQAVVLATVFKVRARKIAEATVWIQEDLEKVKNEAAKFQSTSLKTDATLGLPITVVSADDFVQNDTLKVGTDPTNYKITLITAITGGVQLTIEPLLKKNQAQGTAVVETTLFPYTSLKSDVSATTSVLPVSSVDGFVAGDTLSVGTDATSNSISIVTTTTNPPTLTLSAGLGTAQSIGAVVVKNTRCNPDVDSQAIGFAKLLWDKLLVAVPLSTANSNSAGKDLSKVPHTLTRTLNYRVDSSTNPIHPYNVLSLNYTVVPQSGGSAIANMTTEVTPDAVFQCTPQ